MARDVVSQAIDAFEGMLHSEKISRVLADLAAAGLLQSDVRPVAETVAPVDLGVWPLTLDEIETIKVLRAGKACITLISTIRP